MKKYKIFIISLVIIVISFCLYFFINKIKNIYINEIDNKEIVVGDLLSGMFSNGGHIAIVIGIKDEYYYIAESLYEDNHTYYGVIARKYKFNELGSYFSWHIDMSNFYIENGNLTDYWIN